MREEHRFRQKKNAKTLCASKAKIKAKKRSAQVRQTGRGNCVVTWWHLSCFTPDCLAF